MASDRTHTPLFVADAFRSLFATDSPPDRTRLATAAAQLPVRDGGLGLANYASAPCLPRRSYM